MNRLTCTWIETISQPDSGSGPVALARNLGFSAQELRRIERILAENERDLLEERYASFGQ
jgi:hypothetical protein